MKKRFFAGLLACLMVVGLLPLSMLLKPVNAKADSVADDSKKIYTLESKNLKELLTGSNSSESKIYESNGFKFEILKNASISDSTKTWHNSVCTYSSEQRLKFGGAVTAGNLKSGKNAIKITTEKKSIVRIWWVCNDNKIQCVQYNAKDKKLENVKTPTGTFVKNSQYFNCYTVDAGEYYIGSDKGGAYIFKIEVEELSETDNICSITVNDTYEDKEELCDTNLYVEGDTIALKAADTKKKKFLYWVNSYGRIVSRDAEYSFPVYYSDTYTAIYETEETKVNYLTAYGKIVKSITKSEFNVSEEQAGPVRYGYEFTGWDKTNAEISKLLEEGSVDVNPIYESDSKKIYDITIDTSALGGSKTTKSDCVINTPVTASTTSDDFAYWEDEAGNKLSYNPTYTFFATRALSVIAVSKEQEKDTTTEKALITKVYSEEENTVAGTKVVIFEYTVPVDYTMNFAGVIASKDNKEVTVTSTTNKYGDYSEKYKTYRYTVTKSGTDTWYIMPVLTYTANGETKTINGDMVTLK